jgi:hypothetical protein
LQPEAEASKLQSQIVESPDQQEAKLNFLQEVKEKYEADKQQLTEVRQEMIWQKDLCKKFLHLQEERLIKLKEKVVNIKHIRSVPADALKAPDVPLVLENADSEIHITDYE